MTVEEDDGDSQSRYPSIPSLVALQMMKNRLQLAHLGKKLMKWSSMATGKELRKRALQMNRDFEDYGEHVADAYLLLARARFYNPEINKNVLQNVGRSAACVVDFGNKTLIGVRFFEMTVNERKHDPNLHLGLEKGGEAIAAAKRAWRDLLKEMILLLECETAFQRIYSANKSSTKKHNVLGKVIIPKITNAIAYIKSELEEKEREETFRLKRFKYSKMKKLEREKEAKKKLKKFQEPETIIEEPDIIQKPETIAELQKIEEPKIIEKLDNTEETDVIEKLENIEEIDILAELDIFEEPETNELEKSEEPEKELEKIEPKVMMLQIETSKQKVIEPETNVLETVAPEVTVSVSDITFSYTAMSEVNVADIMPEVKLQEPYIILPEFIIQGEPSPLEKQKTFIPEIIFEGKSTKVAKTWDQFVNTTPYKDMSETASTKQSMESSVSCPLCKAQSDVTNQRVLHLIDHVNQFLMLCKQNKIDFTKLESKGDKFNYRNIKKELELLSFSYHCPHKSSEERSKGDVGKRSCLLQRPDLCDDFKRRRGKEQESIYKCLSRQSSAMSYACKKTQIDNMTNNGSVISFFPTNCKFSLHSQCLADANYFEYCNWTPELTLQYEKNHNYLNPGTSTRREKDNNGTQTSHHLCRCLSGERSLSIKESQSPKPSNYSPYFKKSPTYYTSMPQTHYSSLSRKLMRTSLSNKNTSNVKCFTNLIQNAKYKMPMALYASESRSGSRKVSDIIYTSDWTNVIVPKEFATIATYQPSNLFSPYIEGLYDSYEISDTFHSVDSSNTMIRKDSLTCMTVLPQGYQGVVPYMSRFGFADVINNNPGNVSILKEYAKYNDRQFCKGLVPYTPEGRPGPSGISGDVSPVFFITNDSTSCSSDDTASIFSISDTEINEDCVSGVLFQNDANLDIDAQNEKTNARNLSQDNADSINELGDKLNNKNYHIYVILTPDQNWPFNSYMQEKTHKKNAKNYQIGAEYQKDSSSSKTTRSGTCKLKDFSVYVTLTPSQNSRFKPSRSPGLSTSNKFDESNTTGTATYIDHATYVTTVRRKSKSSSYKTCSESADPIQSRSGLGGVFDVRNITATETVTYTAPYTREGKPGPSDFSKANNEQFGRVPYTRPYEINITNSRLITSNTPFTREGKPGPFSIYEASNINTTNHIEPVPYTREGRPGPFDIYEKNAFCAPYTRERTSGPYVISELKNIRLSVPCAREGRLSRNSLITTTFSTPKNQECGPGRCGVYSVVCVYTSEGTPRHCGLIEVCKNTCSNPCTSSNERKCGHFGTSEISNIADYDSVTPSLPYTREGRQMLNDIYSISPMTIASSKPNTQECGPGRCGVYSIVCVYTGEEEPTHCGLIEICKNPCSKALVSSTCRRIGKSGPCGTSEINDITASQKVTCFLPCTRERKHGSSITDASNIISSKQIGSVPYTREGKPGPFDISETSNNIASIQITPYTREGKPGPFSIFEKNNIITTKQIAPAPYTREGKPGPFDISDVNIITTTKQIGSVPYTREGRPGPFDISEKNNIIATKQIAPVPYTREGRPGPFEIYEMSNDTASKHVTPYTREGKPEPFNIFDVNDTITDKQIAPVPYTCKEKLGPFDISKINNNITSKPTESSVPYIRESSPGPCDISEANYTTNTKQNYNNITAPKLNKSPKPRESIPIPCISEPSNINNSFLSYTEPCEVYSIMCGYTREGKQGSCCNIKTNDITTPYTREGKPGPFSISETDIITTSKQCEPIPFSREARPGPFNISEMNSCGPNQIKPCKQESTPGPCGILDESNMVCPKYPCKSCKQKYEAGNITASDQSDPIAYTREGRPGPFDISKTISDNFKLSDDLKTVAAPRVCTRDSIPVSIRLSEIGNVTTNKEISETNYYNVFMATTNPCQCGFNAPSTQKATSSSATSKSDESCIETEYKKHTKNFRYLECDGTIVDEKRITIITIKKRKPRKQDALEANKSTCISQNLENGSNLKCKCCKESKSENIRSSPDVMPCPKMRTSISTQVLNTGNCNDKKLEDQASSPKCDCGDKEPPKPPSIPCPNKPEEKKCDCGAGASAKPSSCACSKKPEDSASGPKCHCGEGASAKPSSCACSKKPDDSASGTKCHCGEGATAKPSSCACSKKPEDSASGPKCNCGEGAIAKPSSCACSKKPKDSASGTKCNCGEGATAKPSSCACSKRPEDSASDPKCKCGEGATAKPSSCACSKKPEDSASGPKCHCGEGASAKPSSCACSKKPEDSASGPKCHCGEGATAKPSSCACSKKPEDSASGSKCHCGEGASAKPSSCACSKKPEDSASGPKCHCGEGATAKPSSCACSKKPEDSASGPKCHCGEGASAKPSSCACSKKPKDSASGPKCNCGEGAIAKPSSCACSKKPEDSASGPKCHCGEGVSAKPSSCACSKKPEDSASGLKCHCGEGATAKPSSCACSKKPEDSASGPNCKCGDKAPSKPPPAACSNMLKDSASTQKCDCGEGASSKPPPIPCPNKPKDSPSGSKCNCGEGASAKPSSCACSKKPEDSASGPKCKCGDKAPPKPPPPLVCANRLEDSASGPKCDCGEKASKPSSLVCANRLEDSASGPKCDCGEKTSKAPSLVCANRLEDSASGPKCDCGEVAPSKPPLKSILVCANRLEDSASGPKCDCGDKAPKPPPLVCANRLEDSASGPKCGCGKKTSKPPSVVCANRLEDSASGPKCDCGEVAPPEPPPVPCPNKPKDAASGQKCNCGAPPIPCPNKPKDSASGPKCDCGGGAPPKLPSIPCPNKPKDAATGPKCDCGAPPIPCPNKPKDSASGPKCNCGGGAPPKPPSIPCPNKPKDADSGPKCNCGGEAPPPIPCPNKPKDSASGPKCDCEGGAPSKKSSISCSNKLKDSESSPKCSCGGGAPAKPPPIPCPNKLKDSASGPKCNCGVGASSKPSSCSCSKMPEDSGQKCACGGGAPSKKSSSIACPNKSKDLASGPKCDCGVESKPLPVPCPNKPKDSASSPKCNCGGGAPSKKSSISCSNKLKDSASSPKCNCGGGAPSKPPPIPCPNKPKDSASGPKCNCGGGAPSKKSSSISCSNKLKDSASSPKCNCGGGAPSKPPPIPCPNKPKDSTSGPKCDCGGGAPSKKSSSISCSNKLKDSASSPKCNCGGGAPSKPPPIPCPNKPKDSASGPKCDCGEGARSKKPSSIECPNKLKESASGPKCECGGGGNKPKNSTSSCSQVSGNRVVDLTHGAQCECGDKTPSKLKESASDAKCHCVKEPPLSFDPVCPNLSRGSKTSNVSKKNSKTRNAPKCDCCKSDCAKEAPPKPKSACGGGAPSNTTGCGNKVEETCQTGVPDYPLCACTGEALSKALLQKVLDTLRCQKSPVICAPPDKPDRHANCFKENSPSGSNKKKTCALCGSPLTNKDTRPSTKVTCVCSDGSVHSRNVNSKSKTNKNNKNTTCGYCTFGRLAQNSNGQSNKICEIDNKNHRPHNSTREQNDNVTKFCPSTNKKKDDNASFCTIKIITKSSKSRCCGTEYKSNLAYLATNTLDALRQLYRSPDHRKNKNICQTCYSPLTPSVGSEVCQKPYVLCEFCQDKLVQENERGYRCTTYGVESTSCRSATEGSPSRSMYSQKTNASSRGCGNCRKL